MISWCLNFICSNLPCVSLRRGGVNALRFTPWFHVTAHEIDLVVDVVEQALTEYLRDEAEGEVEDKVTSPSSAAFIPTLRLTRWGCTS